VRSIAACHSSIREANFIHLVGKTCDICYYEAAVTSAGCRWLSERGISPIAAADLDSIYDLTKAQGGEIAVYGTVHAQKKAKDRYIRTALEATSKHGRGLEDYYLTFTRDDGIRVRLLWQFIVRRIIVRYRRFLYALN
jgi:hypothetical protein